MKIITHKTYNPALYSLRHPFAAFYLHLQSCSSLHSFKNKKKSTESILSDNIKSFPRLTYYMGQTMAIEGLTSDRRCVAREVAV